MEYLWVQKPHKRVLVPSSRQPTWDTLNGLLEMFCLLTSWVFLPYLSFTHLVWLPGLCFLYLMCICVPHDFSSLFFSSLFFSFPFLFVWFVGWLVGFCQEIFNKGVLALGFSYHFFKTVVCCFSENYQNLFAKSKIDNRLLYLQTHRLRVKMLIHLGDMTEHHYHIFLCLCFRFTVKFCFSTLI